MLESDSRASNNLILIGPSSGSISRNITSPRAGRRQSTILMNLQLNEPVVPGLGEMVNEDHPALSRGSMAGSPTTHFADLHHRGRNPSLGELHQELEQEQEAHVVSQLPMLVIVHPPSTNFLFYRIVCFNRYDSSRYNSINYKREAEDNSTIPL